MSSGITERVAAENGAKIWKIILGAACPTLPGGDIPSSPRLRSAGGAARCIERLWGGRKPAPARAEGRRDAECPL